MARRSLATTRRWAKVCFLQAEDGIRDYKVTGVQTCALPIYSSEQTHRTADLWTVGIDGSGMRDLSRKLDRDPDNLRWAPDGKGVYFTAPDRGAINIRYADLSGGVRAVTQGAQVVSLASLARTLVATGVRSDPGHSPDVVRIDLRRGQATPVTAVNDDVLANKRLAQVEEVWYASSGGSGRQGVVVQPPAVGGLKREPVTLEVDRGAV